MYLFVDTETTGLPRRWDAPPSLVDNWPRLVQIAWAGYDAHRRPLAAEVHLVKPEGFTIPADATRVHGISTAQARDQGLPLTEVLDRFAAALAHARVVVAHNLSFDSAVITAEFLRAGRAAPLDAKDRVCTMRVATDYCRLPGPRGFKWPTLTELHTTLFGDEPLAAHEAAADVATCVKCFFELKKRRVILAG